MTAHAQEATSPSGECAPTPRQFQAAVAVASGAYTQDDVNVVKELPCFAAQVPDPHAETEIVMSEAQSDAALSDLSPGDQASGSHCPSGSGEHSYGHLWRNTSLLGNKIYDWVWMTRYCLSTKGTPRVIKYTQKVDHTEVYSGGVEIQKVTTNTDSNPPGVAAWAFRQRHIQLCLPKVGCNANNYPHGTLSVLAYGNIRTAEGAAK
jgi:hypothetical protein